MADDTNTAEREAAEQWLRDRYGAYRGNFAWRELEEAFLAGRASLAASAGSEPVAYVDRADAVNLARNLLDEPREVVVTRRGIQTLCKAVLAMDAVLLVHPSPPGGMAGWKDIATAPRDGTPIWLYTASGQCEGYWNYGEWVQDAVYCTYDGAGGPAFQCNPTHWQPLPAPPLPASEAKEL